MLHQEEDNSTGREILEVVHPKGEEITAVVPVPRVPPAEHKKSEVSGLNTQNEGLKLERISNGMLVLAVLIATITYQAGLSPPPSIWKQDMSLNVKCFFTKDTWFSDRPCPSFTFYVFMCFNTTGFFSSTIVMVLALADLKTRVLRKMARLLIVSLMSVFFTYFTLLSSISTNSLPYLVMTAIAFVMTFFGCFYLYLLSKLVNRLKRIHARIVGTSVTQLPPQGRVSLEVF